MYNKKGFTLIELIIVIAIVAIIAAITVVSVSNYINKANASVALTNGKTVLNVCERLTGQINNGNEELSLDAATVLSQSSVTVFEGTSAVSDSIVIEIEDDQVMTIWSMKGNTLAKWTRGGEWVVTRPVEEGVSENPVNSVEIDLKNVSVSDYNKVGNWSITANGFYSDNGLLFIPNRNEQYTINVVAKLGTPTSGTAGGYGILFETKVDSNNKDTGYVLQFDRGLGAIVIRSRNNGNETAPIITVNHSSNSIIPTDKNAAWWTAEHTITMKIEKVSNTKKKISVKIDGTLVIDGMEFSSNIDPNDNNTGFRSWAGASAGGAEYFSISVT